MTLCVDRPLLFTRCENRQWCVCGRACTFKLVERLPPSSHPCLNLAQNPAHLTETPAKRDSHAPLTVWWAYFPKGDRCIFLEWFRNIWEAERITICIWRVPQHYQWVTGVMTTKATKSLVHSCSGWTYYGATVFLPQGKLIYCIIWRQVSVRTSYSFRHLMCLAYYWWVARYVNTPLRRAKRARLFRIETKVVTCRQWH